MALMGQTLPRVRVVEAEKFILRDSDGKARVILGAESPGSTVPDPAVIRMVFPKMGVYGLHLYSPDGRYRAGLIEAEPGGTGAQLRLLDSSTPSSAYLAVDAGVAALNLTATEKSRDAAEREQSEWGTKFNAAKTPEERERLFLSAPFDGAKAALSAFPKGTSSLSLERGSNGKYGGIAAYLTQDGQAAMWLNDERGMSRAVLGGASLENKATGVKEQRPASSLILFDKDGKVIWKAP
jgi:hypothetical protein